MDSIQKKEFELLHEVINVCRKNGLHFLLGGGTAWDAMQGQGFTPGQYVCTLFMPAADTGKLIKLLSATLPENRALECMELDVSYAEYDVRYVATDTTLFSTYNPSRFKNPGIFVRIVRYYPELNSSIRRRMNTALIKCLEETHPSTTAHSKNKLVKLAKKLYSAAEKKIGRKSIVKKTLAFVASEGCKYDRKTRAIFRFFGKKNVITQRKYLESVVNAEFEGELLPQSYGVQYLLQSYYGKDTTRNFFPPQAFAPKYLVADPYTPFAEYFNEFNFAKYKSKRSALSSLLTAYKKKLEPLREEYSNYASILRNTDKKMKALDFVEKNKDEIVKAYESGDHITLSTLLAPYYDLVEKTGENYLEVDNEVRRIASESAYKCGRYTYALSHALPETCVRSSSPDGKMVLLELLTELDRICEKNGIKYVLGRDTALKAFEKSSLSGCETSLSVVMTYKDSEKFKKIVRETRKDRRIEGIEDCPAFADMSLRYSDPLTTSINTQETGLLSSYGISIVIERARRLPKTAVLKKFRRMFEMLLLVNASWGHKMREKDQVMKTVLPRFLVRFIFKCVYADPWLKPLRSGHYFICRYPKNSKTISASCLTSRKSIKLSSNVFQISKDPADYLKQEYGSSYKSKITTSYSDSRYVTVFDPRMPFDEYYTDIISEYRKNNIAMARRQWYYTKYFQKKKQRKINKYWDILFRTDARFKLWLEYYPQKEELLELYKNKEYGELRLRLYNYRVTTETFLKKGLAVSCDPQIQEIVEKLYMLDGKQKIVSKIHRLMPAEYKKEMKVTVTEHD